MDDVGGVALPQLRAQRTRARQRPADHPLSLLALPGEIVEQRRGLWVGAGRADEDAVEGRDPFVHLHDDLDEAGQLLLRIAVGDERSDLGSLGHRDGLVVADDRHVEQRLEDPVLRREESVHGRGGDGRLLADGLDGGRPVPALEEQAARRVHHGGSRQARPGLVWPDGGRSGGWHDLRLALSKRE